MSRSAAKAAMPRTDLDDDTSVADMLADGAFQARLAKARSEREKALADLGGDEAPLRRRKPWERGAVDRPASPQADPLVLTEQERLPGAAPVAIAGGAGPAPVQRQTEPDARAHGTDSSMRQRKGSLLVVLGFLAGIVVGAGVTALVSYSPPPLPSPEDGVTNDQTGLVNAATAAVTEPEVASPVASAGAAVASVAGSPALDESAPAVFADEPLFISTPAATPVQPGVPSLDERGVARDTSPASLAAPADQGHDLSLSQQASWIFPPQTGFPQAVFLQAPTGLAGSVVAEARDALDRAGFTIADTRRVRLSISRSNVRYFHPEDAAAAARLAEEIGALARDFTSYRPSPRGGTLEVWLAGRTTGGGRAVANPQQAARDEQLLFLRRFIIEKLRAAGDPRP